MILSMVWAEVEIGICGQTRKGRQQVSKESLRWNEK